MAPKEPLAAGSSSRLPDGVVVQPRRFAFRDLESIPQYWFAGNPIITHIENAFSILIPPGERFFIHSVRSCADRAGDAEERDLIRAFVQQEGLHSRAHDQFNDSFERHGIDVAREKAHAERAIARLRKYLPLRMQLGATAFLEHLTATGAHMLFAEPLVAESIHPEALRFWRWHAAEELEHKAVAFDLFRRTGGGYLLRVLSAIAALVLLVVPFDRSVRRMMKDDGRPVTAEHRAQARAINRKLMGSQLRMIARYFRPGFHPWQLRDEKWLADWYAAEPLQATAPPM